MKILVTGGAGFLGSNLCKVLLDRGNHVTCIDNMYTGREENVTDLTPNSRFEYIFHDIREPLNVTDIDEIYNLACPASPPHYQRDPIYTLDTSVMGMRNILKLAESNKARVLQASTSEVYGDPSVHPQPEEYFGNVNPIGIRSCYDEGKRVAETMCMDAYMHRGIQTRIVRIFNTYGPNMDPNDGRVVSNFICQALRGEPLTVYGDGSQTRSFCYVDDLVNGIVAMMNQDDWVGPVNLGNPGEFTILQLAEMVTEMTGSEESIIFKELPKDDPTQRRPDISKAREKLLWSPTVKLLDGLEKTIEYFKGVV